MPHAASAARQPLNRKDWSRCEAPPALKANNPPLGGTRKRAEIKGRTQEVDTGTEARAQRQIAEAQRLDCEADALLIIGFRQPAERIAHRAAALRQAGSA